MYTHQFLKPDELARACRYQQRYTGLPVVCTGKLPLNPHRIWTELYVVCVMKGLVWIARNSQEFQIKQFNSAEFRGRKRRLSTRGIEHETLREAREVGCARNQRDIRRIEGHAGAQGKLLFSPMATTSLDGSPE